MYKLNYVRYPSFLKEMAKYNKLNKNNPLFKDRRKEVITTLMNSPKNNRLKPHNLKGKLSAYWSITTGLNSDADRVVFKVDEKNHIVYLKSVGDHSVYESLEIKPFREFLETFE